MLKKVFPFILAAFIGSLALGFADKILTPEINKLYYPAYGDSLDDQKIQGIILQETAMERGDSLPLYGSSELTSIENPYHPLHFLSENRGIQVNLIGRGYCQSLIQLINYGALGDILKGKKIALIHFSEQQYLDFLFNNKISRTLKTYVAQRVGSMIEHRADTTEVRLLNYLYLKNNIVSRFFLEILEPFYRMKLQLLSFKDKVTAYHLLTQETGLKEHTIKNDQISQKGTDWDAAIKAAEKSGAEKANNNAFYMDNKYYDRFVRDKVVNLKDHMKDQSYLDSPEYQDFKELLELCRQQDIKPLFISIPVNGRWYDYSGFNKNDREQYYENIRMIVSSYGFSLADFSEHEYDKYFLQDGMHLGWKGWVYVNEALSSYFDKRSTIAAHDVSN